MLGVACGSLGALTADDRRPISTRRSGASRRGDWTPRALPALVAERDGGEPLHALNDLVFVRDGAGQVMVEIEIDGDAYIRFAGDGVVAATPLGSTAYTLASGGPMLAPGLSALVLTPLSPHGGVCPPLVAGRRQPDRAAARPRQRRRAAGAGRPGGRECRRQAPISLTAELTARTTRRSSRSATRSR